MTASICWSRVDPSPERLSVMAPSKFMEQMSRANLGLPCSVGPQHQNILVGLSAAWGGDDNENPYIQIADLIEKYGDIELWPEY